MNKVIEKICMGTTCFVMGASELQELSDIIPEKYGDKVEVVASTCLDFCSSSEESQAPYVMVDYDVISKATVEKVLEAIDGKLNNGQE